MKRKVISLLLAVAMMMNLLTLSACGGREEPPVEAGSASASVGQEETVLYATRAQWIELLGQTFGLDNFSQQTPYYEDVQATDEIFAYVQSCREWGALTEEMGNAFAPNENATRGFVVQTAILAAELNVSEAAGEGLTQMLNYAVQKGVVSSAQDEPVEYAECVIAVQKIKELQLNEVPEQYENIVLNKNVQDFSAQSGITYSGTKVTMPAELAKTISEGSVFVVPGYPYGTAVKATEISTNGDTTTVQTVEPALEEIVDELNFSFVGAPKIEDVVPGEGIELVQGGVAPLNMDAADGAKIVPLSYSSHPDGPSVQNLSKINIPEFGLKVDFNKGVLKPNVKFVDWFSVEGSKKIMEGMNTVTEEKGFDDVKNTLDPGEYKFESGFELLGSVTVKELYIESKVETSKLLGVPIGIKKMENELHVEVEGTLSIKGKYEGETTLFSTVIAGPAGVWFKVSLKLYVGVNGELSVKATIDHTTNVNYKNGVFSKTQETIPNISTEAKVEIESGLKGEAVVTFLGIELVDLSAKVGAGMDVSATVHAQTIKPPAGSDIPSVMVCSALNAYIPTVEIGVGVKEATLANKLKLTLKVKLVGKKGKALAPSPLQSNLHFEVSDLGAQFVDECTWELYKGEPVEEEKPDSSQQGDQSTEQGDQSVQEGTADQSGQNPENGAAGDKNDVFAALTLNTAMMTLKPNETRKIVVTALPGGVAMSDVRFETLNPSVARVDGNGTVIAVAEGNTKIRAYTSTGHEQYCSITVLGGESSFTPNEFI